MSNVGRGDLVEIRVWKATGHFGSLKNKTVGIITDAQIPAPYSEGLCYKIYTPLGLLYRDSDCLEIIQRDKTTWV
jgi:hypothetical protein